MMLDILNQWISFDHEKHRWRATYCPDPKNTRRFEREWFGSQALALVWYLAKARKLPTMRYCYHNIDDLERSGNAIQIKHSRRST